jgi:sigma-54 specific flagellar transcriptional regulator A
MLPPLRERTADISALFFHFWHKHGETRMVAPAVLRALESYPWPGNVRELENLVERVSVCAESQVINLNDLPAPFRGGGDPTSGNTFTLAPVPDVVGAGALFDIADAMPQVDTGEIPLGPITTVEEETVVIPSRDPPAAIVEDPDPTPVLDLPVARPFPSSPTMAQPGIAARSPFRLPVDLPRLLRETEETYIRLALEESGGNKKEAAKLLGMGRTTLVEKLRRKAASDEAQTPHDD